MVCRSARLAYKRAYFGVGYGEEPLGHAAFSLRAVSAERMDIAEHEYARVYARTRGVNSRGTIAWEHAVSIPPTRAPHRNKYSSSFNRRGLDAASIQGPITLLPLRIAGEEFRQGSGFADGISRLAKPTVAG